MFYFLDLFKASEFLSRRLFSGDYTSLGLLEKALRKLHKPEKLECDTQKIKRFGSKIYTYCDKNKAFDPSGSLYYLLGLFHLFGYLPAVKDYEQCINFFDKGIQCENSQALFYRAYMHEHGLGEPENFEEAIRIYEYLIDQDHPHALYRRAEMYRLDRGGCNPIRRNLLYEKAIQHNFPGARDRLAVIYYQGDQGEVRKDLAARLYREGYEKKDRLKSYVKTAEKDNSCIYFKFHYKLKDTVCRSLHEAAADLLKTHPVLLQKWLEYDCSRTRYSDLHILQLHEFYSKCRKNSLNSDMMTEIAGAILPILYEWNDENKSFSCQVYQSTDLSFTSLLENLTNKCIPKKYHQHLISALYNVITYRRERLVLFPYFLKRFLDSFDSYDNVAINTFCLFAYLNLQIPPDDAIIKIQNWIKRVDDVGVLEDFQLTNIQLLSDLKNLVSEKNLDSKLQIQIHCSIFFILSKWNHLNREQIDLEPWIEQLNNCEIAPSQFEPLIEVFYYFVIENSEKNRICVPILNTIFANLELLNKIDAPVIFRQLAYLGLAIYEPSFIMNLKVWTRERTLQLLQDIRTKSKTISSDYVDYKGRLLGPNGFFSCSEPNISMQHDVPGISPP